MIHTLIYGVREITNTSTVLLQASKNSGFRYNPQIQMTFKSPRNHLYPLLSDFIINYCIHMENKGEKTYIGIMW